MLELTNDPLTCTSDPRGEVQQQLDDERAANEVLERKRKTVVRCRGEPAVVWT